MNSIEQFLQNNQYFSRFFEAPPEIQFILILGMGAVLAFCGVQIDLAVERWRMRKYYKDIKIPETTKKF